MKKNVLKLNQFSKAELNARRKNALRGGSDVCACICVGCLCVGGVDAMEKKNEIDDYLVGNFLTFVEQYPY